LDYTTAYLTKQIIAYIGNKRRLLELIHLGIKSSVGKVEKGMKFLDVFSGSGIVSRLAKSLNFEVFCNDW
jgi:adenine-specific DNA-methyltransferase